MDLSILKRFVSYLHGKDYRQIKEDLHAHRLYGEAEPVDCTGDIISQMHGGYRQRHQRRVQHNSMTFWRNPLEEHPSELLCDQHLASIPSHKRARRDCLYSELSTPEDIYRSEIM